MRHTGAPVAAVDRDSGKMQFFTSIVGSTLSKSVTPEAELVVAPMIWRIKDHSSV